MVLGGSSSAPNLQDYARVHRKKLTSSGFLDGMCKHAHISWRKKDQQMIFMIKTISILHRLKIHFAVICIVFPLIVSQFESVNLVKGCLLFFVFNKAFGCGRYCLVYQIFCYDFGHVF